MLVKAANYEKFFNCIISLSALTVNKKFRWWFRSWDEPKIISYNMKQTFGTFPNLPGKKPKENIQLKREIGLFSAVNLIIGSIIGSGIFVTPTSALARSGSVGLSLIVWALCGVISLLGAATFAELGTLVPKSGAEYTYFLEAFGKLHPYWGPLPSFLCGWIHIFLLQPGGMAVVCLTFAEYACQPFSTIFLELSQDEVAIVKKLIALCALGLISAINFTSVKLYVKLQNLFTISKLIACAIVIFGGIYHLCNGETEHFSDPFQGSTTSAKDIALAFYSGLWAYGGWSVVNTVTEEMKEPEKNIPRSLAIAVPAVTGIYVMMNVAYMTVLSTEQMLKAPAVAVVFAERTLGPYYFLIPLGVALSTFGCALNSQFGSARFYYVAGREGHMVQFLSYIHLNRLTPAPAVSTQGLLTFLFLIIGNINNLIDFTSFLSWIFYGVAMIALILMRYTKKDVYRPFKVNIIIPILIIFVAIFLSAVPIIMDPSPKYFIGLGFILVGVVVYTPLVYYKKTPEKLIRKVTHIVQALLQVVPPDQEIFNSAVKK